MTETGPDEQEWQRLHPDVVKVTVLAVAAVAVLAAVPTTMVVASATSLPVALAWVLPAVVAVTGAAAGVDLLRVRHTRYRLTGERLELHSGIVFRTRRVLARERIRSVDVSAHPLLRVFGLVRVKVGTGQTGSGEGATTERTIDLDSVSRAAGDHLRTELLRRGAAVDHAGSTDERLATWHRPWVRYLPLSFLTPTLAAGLVGVTFQVSDWFGRGGLPVEIVADLVARHGAWLVLGLGALGLGLVGVLGSLVLLGETWWDHRLDREPGGTLRVRRGLLTTRSLSLEEERIRGVEIVEPLGIRAAGAARLDVVAIGLRSSDPSGDISTLLPPAPTSVVLAAAREVAGPFGSTTLRPHPASARRRRLGRASLVVLALIGAVTAVHLHWTPPAPGSVAMAGAAAALAVAAVWTAVDSYSSLGHTIDGAYLVTRRGSVRRSTVRLQRSGIIGWRIRQSVLQRRLGLITVEATTAAGRRHYAVVDADEHEALDLAAEVVPDLLEPFLVREPSPSAAPVPTSEVR